MGVTVAFVYSAWVQRYPEFAGVDQQLVTAYFNEACIYQRNDGIGWVTDVNLQTFMLNMLTAHICQLNAPIGGAASPQTVGRINSAGQGSVSVALSMNAPEPGTEAWAQQTKYGLAWWNASAAGRTARYIPPSHCRRGVF